MHDIELITGETGDGKRDTQPLRILPVARQPLDIVGRIAISSLGNAVEHTLDLIETQRNGLDRDGTRDIGLKALA